MSKPLAVIIAVVVAVAVDLIAGFFTYRGWATLVGGVVGGVVYLLLRLGWGRKAIAVFLTLGALLTGTIGVLSGSGYESQVKKLWSSAECNIPGRRYMLLQFGSRGIILIYEEILDPDAVRTRERHSGPGWYYSRSISLRRHIGQCVRSTSLIVSFIIPIFLAALSSSYPVVLFIRGPLRRYRRRKRGLCLNCGYNLTGNVSGVCPECGEAA